MNTKQIYCKQLECETLVCDWYECPSGSVCEPVKTFYRFIQTNDDPADVQLIDEVLFYTPDSTTDPQLTKAEREQVAERWKNGQ